MKNGALLLAALPALLIASSLLSSRVGAQARFEDQVPVGTRFVALLSAPLSSKEGKTGDRVELTTIEPLETASGKRVPEGATVHAHIDKVERAHQTGRARMWITIDEIETKDGRVPLVAVVSDVPGVHSVKVNYNREGMIETRSSRGEDEAMAVAAGAFVGAMPGAAAHNEKDAAYGAAIGAATAFMATSGLGSELTLDKNTKIELALERPLTLRHR